MKEIKLTKGKVALVDDEDYEWLSQWKWYFRSGRGKEGYAVRQKRIANGKQITIYMHKQILDCPPNLEGDHKDRNSLNNQRSNLRVATRSQNNSNTRRTRTSASGYRGVVKLFCANGSFKYRAQIKVDKKTITLGNFDDPIEAAYSYNQAALKYYGEFATLNQINIKT